MSRNGAEAHLFQPCVRAPVGFVIVTHRDPEQVLRLVVRLRDLFGPVVPIAIHHDFGQCPLDTKLFPRGVSFVRPHFATRWGAWGVVEGELAALRLLYGGGVETHPEHVVLLSGADYPVAPAQRVLADLRSCGADAYLDARPVHPWRRTRQVPGPLGLGPNAGPSNEQVCFRRYYSSTFHPLGMRVRVKSPALAPLLAPFSRRFRCWAGETWWTLGHRGVAYLLSFHEERPEIVRWFAGKELPEEAYVHTVVCNAPGLRVELRPYRYVDWSSRAPHPRTLDEGDVRELFQSGAHFARKFAPHAPVLDVIDRALGLPAWQGNPPALATAE